ncbi:MAG TPA: 4-alpha-glucanotransferase [bacterium]|nr:4-alpha-glucanotransferase [bacterium]
MEQHGSRTSGILLPVSALPSPFGIGDAGGTAYRFVDWLADAGQSLWQVLPLMPTESGCGNSPYSSPSAFAGNPLFISPEALVRAGLLQESDLHPQPSFPVGRIDYTAVTSYKSHLLSRLVERHPDPARLPGFQQFCAEHADWLEDDALYRALKKHFHGRPWFQWPENIRRRQPAAIDHYQDILQTGVTTAKIAQYLFWRQWSDLKNYANGRGIRLFGDLPIYVTHDSVEVWRYPQFFKLNPDGSPTHVAGVPPDYFSSTGQRWGNPVYDWEALQADGFRWWVRRLRHQFRFFDWLRLDHFRGFAAYWEIPAAEPTAVRGNWTPVPGAELFSAIRRELPDARLVAEDLGIITDDVRALMARFGLPGMKVLVFAFGDDARNPYLPHNHVPNSVVVTGTHDTNTAAGWLADDATPAERDSFTAYTGAPSAEMLVRLALASVAETAIIPVQDILGLGSAARINRPGTAAGNWEWQLAPAALTPQHRDRLAALTRIYGRERR